MILLPGDLSLQITSPVFLFIARKLGALGRATSLCASSTPLDVLTKSTSPIAVTEQLHALCGEAPSLLIMSIFQTMSASSLFWFGSSLNGPSFSLSRKPSVSRQTISSRLVTYHRRFPSTQALQQTPRYSQFFTT